MSSWDSRANLKKPTHMTASSISSIVAQKYQGRLLDWLPPIVNRMNGPTNAAATNLNRDAGRSNAPADAALTFKKVF
jgi:hypothetical protein